MVRGNSNSLIAWAVTPHVGAPYVVRFIEYPVPLSGSAAVFFGVPFKI
jgi:hypothetical protein